MWKMKCQFLSRWDVIFSWISVIGVSRNTSSFCMYNLEVLREIITVEQNEHVVCSWYVCLP